MSKGGILTFVNIISALPMLLYPAVFLAGWIALTAPGGIASLEGWVIFLLSALYPVVIVACIFVSRLYSSLFWACLGLVPGGVLAYLALMALYIL